MKKLVVLLTLMATASAFSQSTLGKINFNNRIGTVKLDAPVSYDASGPATAGKIDGAGTKVVGSLDWGGKFARAALYGGAAGTAEGDLQLLVPAVTFRSGSLAGGIFTTSASRDVPGTQPGQAGVFQMRAWDTGKLETTESYANALAQPEFYAGKSVLINIAQLGGGTFVTPNLGANTGIAGEWGLTPFSITYTPEPSIIGLGILGALAGLFVFRRRE